jgi:hypothetical protein
LVSIHWHDPEAVASLKVGPESCVARRWNEHDPVGVGDTTVRRPDRSNLVQRSLAE